MTKAQLQTIADLVAIAHDEYDGCPSYRDDLERFDRVLAEIKAEGRSSPGNAAALREALGRIVEWADRYVGRLCFHGPSPEMDGWRTASHAANDALALARVALSAPARNVDRFATAEEAVAAFADHLRAWENAHGICSEYPDHAVKVPAGAFAWLFAPPKDSAQ